MDDDDYTNDPGLHLTPLGRRALLIGIIIALAIAIAWALTETAGAQATEWDKSSITLDGRCLPDGSAEFVVTNNGQNMAGPSPWREFEDGSLAQSGEFTLTAGATQTWTFASNGVPIEFQADQRPGHPGTSAPKLTLTCSTPTAVTLRSFGATSLSSAWAGICQRGVVADFFARPGGGVVYVIRSSHAFADSYWTVRYFYKTQRVIVCAGIVS
jgi:hypothetical protein